MGWHVTHQVMTAANKRVVKNYQTGGFDEKWEGRRTTIGAFSVHIRVSGPTFDTKKEALEWATTTRTQGEVADSSQELSAEPTVQPTRKPKRRAKK